MDKPQGPLGGRARRVRRFYGMVSRIYDFFFFQASQEVWEACLSLLHPEDGDRVLDVGSGTGRLAIALADLVGAQGHIDALDLSPAMCREAERQIARTPYGERIAVRAGDARRLPYPDQSFDGALSALTLDLLPPGETEAALRELGRVVRGGGRIVVAALAEELPPGRNYRVYEALRRILPLAALGRPLALRKEAQAAGLRPRIGVRRQFLRLPIDILIVDVPGAEKAKKTP